MNIGKFSVSNPVFVNIVMFVIIFLGIISVFRLPKEDFPEIPFYFISISVPYTGVSADDIERTVTVKIEDEMQNLKFLQELESFTSDGFTSIQLEFEQSISDAEFENALQEVRSRFGNIVLPDDVGNEFIDDFSSTDFFPVIQVSISGDIEYAELITHAERLSRIFKRIDNVSGVTIVGERDLELLVEVNRERSDAYGIGLQEISQAIRNTNVSIPGGTLRSTSQSFLLRTNESIGSAEEMRDVVVRNQGGSIIQIGDIATVRTAYDRDGAIFRYNGQQAIALSVTKIAGGDSVQIVNSVRQATNEYQQSPFLVGSTAQFDFFSDSAVPVIRNIRVLGLNILIGFVLVIGVLYFFLGIRNAFLTALGIPISFGAAFLVLDSIEFTLNSNVLFALVLVLGLIVDHAIVIIENCYRYNLAGLSRKDAAIKGINEVIAPVIAATATTVAAFLPLTFLPGIIGRFLSVVPITVSIALTASTFEALFILPSHYADWGKKNTPLRREDRFNIFRAWFKKILTKIYRYRIITLITFIALIVISVLLFSSVDQDLFVSDEISIFYIDIDMPRGTALDRTTDVIDQFEARLLPILAHEDIVSISSSIGFQLTDISSTTSSDVAQITVDLLDIEEGRERELDAIITESRMLINNIVGPERVRFRKLEGGPPTESPVVFRLYGDSFEELDAVSSAIQERLTTHAQLIDIRDNFEEGRAELRLLINKNDANRYALSAQRIGLFINNAFDGILSGEVFTNNQARDVVVVYEYDTITRPEQLLLLKIPNANGELIPLSSVASIATETSINAIRRRDQRREITIEADALNTENLFVIDNDIKGYFNTEISSRYPDIDLVIGGQFAEFANLLSDIIVVLAIGIFLIYVILGTQFKSYVQPILIIMTIPFSFLGVILYLVISGTSLSTIVIYAAVALAGIAVNDSIVLISFINKLRQEGSKIYDAVINAATLRLRPIVLTSLTTIFGLLPTALGIGGKSIVWIPMAYTIIFGLIFSTITTLIIVPCLYGLFLDRKRPKKRIKEAPATT